MRSELVIRFDYGQIVPWVRRVDHARLAVAGPRRALLSHAGPYPRREHAHDLRVGASRRASACRSRSPGIRRTRDVPEPIDPEVALAETESFWRDWSAECNADLTPEFASPAAFADGAEGAHYAPTGGIVAAPTTSLPEWIGGVRNWDYRYCWLRDATLTLLALLHARLRRRGAAWRHWLLRAVAGDPAELQIMYGVAGERRLTELELPWLPGYEGSAPVRIGNAASEQLQLDVYGEVMDALYQARAHGLPLEKRRLGAAEGRCSSISRTRWREPDEGIWEMRGEPRHFVHSKVMAWVAFDRAVPNGRGAGARRADRRVARAARRDPRRRCCERGFDAARGSFVQSYGSERARREPPDAAARRLSARVGPARFAARSRRSRTSLLEDGFVLRYRTHVGASTACLPARACSSRARSGSSTATS